jgi:D-alanyl-D-alanine carboxypeptidase
MTVAYSKMRWRAAVKNGRIAPRSLEEIWPVQDDPDLGAPALMHPEAALAMGALLRQAWEHGAEGLRVKYSYRTFEMQQRKWEIYQDGGNLAAEPGTSNHGWGVAVDFTGLGEDEINWLRRNARRYGYVNDVESEVWHYTYQEAVWEGEEMTEDERKMLNWLKGFQEATTDTLGGLDNGKAIGKRIGEAVATVGKLDPSGLSTSKHVHRERGRTGPPIPTSATEHVHGEGKTGQAIEP